MPEEYVAAYGSKMNLAKEVIERGSEIAGMFRKTAFSSMTPRAIAASSLYLANREKGKKYTQGEIGKVFGLAEYTVREDSIKVKKALTIR
jgi:transcription initiation factor TFIIIB Brf1 subunit/transcription initiation factor TFIIB